MRQGRRDGDADAEGVPEGVRLDVGPPQVSHSAMPNGTSDTSAADEADERRPVSGDGEVAEHGDRLDAHDDGGEQDPALGLTELAAAEQRDDAEQGGDGERADDEDHDDATEILHAPNPDSDAAQGEGLRVNRTISPGRTWASRSTWSSSTTAITG